MDTFTVSKHARAPIVERVAGWSVELRRRRPAGTAVARAAVVDGITTSAGVVTSAAVLIDATVVRGVLLPDVPVSAVSSGAGAAPELTASGLALCAPAREDIDERRREQYRGDHDVNPLALTRRAGRGRCRCRR